jgi:hypothetical protein
MKSFSSFSVLAAFTAIFALGCAQGNCRSQASSTVNPAQAEVQMKNTSSQQDRIRVFKYDGSLQCNKGKAIALDVMAKDLGSIPVFSSANKSDGLMHIQQCGTPTGKANVYEIDASNLALARKAGFREWTFD